MELEFIVSDESITNSHGFRILTGNTPEEGIDIRGYEGNMPVYYNHDWLMGSLPIGQTSKLEKKDGLLIGTPKLDTDDLDDETKRIIAKIENNMLKAASIGIDVKEWSEEEGTLLQGQARPTVTKSTMFEWSIVGVPANKNCVKLSHKKTGLLLSANADEQYLNKLLPIIEKYDYKMKQVAQKLGLSADADEQTVIAAIDAIQKQSIDQLIAMGKAKGVVNQKNEKAYRSLAAKDYDNTLGLLQLEKEVNEVAAAVESETNTTLQSITAAIKAASSNAPKEDDVNDKSKWTFGKWSKEDPNGLNQIRLNEPERYATLAKAYKGK